MSHVIKICGLSTPDAVATAQDGGASHLGFIFFPKSPRNVAPELAASLVRTVSGVETVAVTVNADETLLDTIVATMSPTQLQLHGSESIDRVREVKARYVLPVIKAFAIRTDDDLTHAKSYAGIADMLLLDAKPPKGSDLPGGNGVSFDWSLVSTLQCDTPVLLSGGIEIGNVGEAVGLVKSDENGIVGLDVSSGVESAPGVKDIGKIRAFLAACSLALNGG